MKSPVALAAFLLLLVPTGLAKDKNTADQDPIVWGMLSQNQGCVIFREYRKTTGMFWGVAVTTKTFSELEVVETQHATLDRAKYKETQDDMDELQRIAMKDRIKFIKIPAKYTPEQLEKARALCTAEPEPAGQ